VFENQDSERLRRRERGRPRRDATGASTRATRRLFSRRSALADATVIENGWIVARTGQHADRLVPLKSIRLLGEHLVDDVMAAATVDVNRRRTAGRDDSGGRAIRGARARDGAGGGVRGCPVRQRFEGDQRGSGVRSVESFESGVVAIVGGRFKGGDFAS
jgi:UDP-N-acetylmuramoylalanine-D-glutamate ligase